MPAFTPTTPRRRDFGDAMPAVMLLVVAGRERGDRVPCWRVVLWLSWTNGSPGDPDLTYTAQNFVDVFSDPRTYPRAARHHRLLRSSRSLVALAFGIPAAWLVERTDFPAKTLLFTLMAVGLLIPGFAAAMGWLFLLHPRIGLLNQLLMTQLSSRQPAVQHHHHRRHGLGAGTQPGAARLHHDGGGVPLAWIRRSRKPRRCTAPARSRSAPRSRCGWPGPASWRPSIYIFMIGVRGLRRAGDHRLGQPHLHLQRPISICCSIRRTSLPRYGLGGGAEHGRRWRSRR